jgi:trans-aconitate 2-methyltransferase
MSWSAAQYAKFEAERNRPIGDLLAHVPDRPVRLAVDLGCGPGNSTELLHNRHPDAEIIGIDSAEDMIAAARRRLPAVDFRLYDIVDWLDEGPFDFILANASLQWVPDHASLFPSMVERLSSGGVLAVQMPENLSEASHRLMTRVASQGVWAERLADVSSVRALLGEPEWYYRMLKERCRSVDIWRTIYHHPLASAAAVVEWFKGSGLRPYLDLLSPDEKEEFLARYRALIEIAYPPLPDGTVLLPFPRLFIVAER